MVEIRMIKTDVGLCYTKLLYYKININQNDINLEVEAQFPASHWIMASSCLLTNTLVWAGFLIWAALSPDELSTQDRAPYSMVTGMDGGSR